MIFSNESRTSSLENSDACSKLASGMLPLAKIRLDNMSFTVLAAQSRIVSIVASSEIKDLSPSLSEVAALNAVEDLCHCSTFPAGAS